MHTPEKALGAREGQGDSMLLAEVVAGFPYAPGGQCSDSSVVYIFIMAYFPIAHAVKDT